MPVARPVAPTYEPVAVAPAVPPALAMSIPTPPVRVDVPALHPAPTPPTDSVAVPAGANEPAAIDDATDDPKRLMAAGLAAEARGDYGDAVKQYEHIEMLSNDEWPAGLKDRLALARSAARGD